MKHIKEILEDGDFDEMLEDLMDEIFEEDEDESKD